MQNTSQPFVRVVPAPSLPVAMHRRWWQRWLHAVVRWPKPLPYAVHSTSNGVVYTHPENVQLLRKILTDDGFKVIVAPERRLAPVE